MGPPGAGKTHTLLGQLGRYADLGAVPRLGSDLLDHVGRTGRLQLTISCYHTAAASPGQARALAAVPHSW
jgi:hypothetical protein